MKTEVRGKNKMEERSSKKKNKVRTRFPAYRFGTVAVDGFGELVIGRNLEGAHSFVSVPDFQHETLEVSTADGDVDVAAWWDVVLAD